MAPTTEKLERVYCIHCKSERGIIRIRADVICEPSQATDFKYRLKRDGQLVASFDQDEVKGWWIDEIPSNPQWGQASSLA